MKGNAGEVEMLRLIEKDHPESSVHVPKSSGRLGGLKPDAWIVDDAGDPVKICDSKAWATKTLRSGINTIQETAEKYANLLPNGGAVQLYFPQDTIKSCSSNELESGEF